LGKAIYGYSRDALTRLMGYTWPGNVRELRNAVEHAVLMCRGEVLELDHLPPALSAAINNGDIKQANTTGRLLDQERLLIQSTLEKVGWNKYRAAQILGVARSTLYSKIQKYGLNPPGREEQG
jgi:DNA-binding NtrC family response regulator